jgi:nucleotide-binding universal stress UspA family protein
MFKKIVVALDGSPNAERILAWVKPYAEKGARLILLQVVKPGYMVPSVTKKAASASYAPAQRYLDRLARKLHEEGLKSKAEVVSGPLPARAIAKAARQEGSDLIAMATHGDSGVLHWLVGGNTDQVLKSADRPVLTVRPGTRAPQGGQVRRILVPLDGSAVAELIVPWIDKLAAFYGAEVMFLHVTPAGEGAGENAQIEALKKLRERIEKVCAQMGRRGVAARFRVEKGEAASTIAKIAKDFDLVATTTNGQGGLKRLAFGSVAEKIVRESEAPVIVFRPSKTAKAGRVVVLGVKAK